MVARSLNLRHECLCIKVRIMLVKAVERPYCKYTDLCTPLEFLRIILFLSTEIEQHVPVLHLKIQRTKGSINTHTHSHMYAHRHNRTNSHAKYTPKMLTLCFESKNLRTSRESLRIAIENSPGQGGIVRQLL